MKAVKIVLLLFLILIIGIFGLILGLHLAGPPGLKPLGEGELPIPYLATPTPPPPALELPRLSLAPQDPLERRLAEDYAALWSYKELSPCAQKDDSAVWDLEICALDCDALAGSGAREALLERLKGRVRAARDASEIYTEELAYRQDLLEELYSALLEERLARPGDYLRRDRVQLRYRYQDGAWELLNGELLYPHLPELDALFAAATEDLDYLPLPYRIEESALCGSTPDEEGFLITFDPSQVEELLQRPEALALIGDETLLWRPDIPFIEGRPIRCYLDESLLVILWQEPEASAVGTFAEVFIADGSQLRRKISSDEPWSLWFETTTSFAKKAKAVLALGGDFYYHGRDCGVSVYQRQILRFRPDNADTCFITADGDLLFRYLGDETGREDTEQFLRDNDVLFSLAFGPVLIDHGVDVTPETYIWGEVRDYYARSALGQLGRHHYLTMNINCDPRVPALDHLPNLRDAANAMVRRGCYMAYTLDGGQTATTVFQYVLVNPVQYGREKAISDIIYFASAVPEE